MNKEKETAKEIIETLIKYANLTPDAIDDLYYLQGYIDRLNDIINKAIEYIKLAIENIEPNLNDDELDDLYILLKILKGE